MFQYPRQQRREFNGGNGFTESYRRLPKAAPDEVLKLVRYRRRSVVGIDGRWTQADTYDTLAHFQHFPDEVEPSSVEVEFSRGPVMNGLTFLAGINAQGV